MSERILPWQTTVINLIQLADEMYDSEDDFKRQVGYLLVDVGVETLFKVYLTLPDLDSSISFNKREDIAKGLIQKEDISKKKVTSLELDKINFHNLAQTVKQVAGSKITEENVTRVEYYHNIRNKIYHAGDGIVPTKENFEKYLHLVKHFLHVLLGADWEKYEAGKKYQGISGMDYLGYLIGIKAFRSEFESLRRDIVGAVALYYPRCITKKFKDELNLIRSKFADILDALPNDSPYYHDTTVELAAEFNHFTRININDANMIIRACEDVTYFQFIILLSQLGEDSSTELEKYLKCREYLNQHQVEKSVITRENLSEFHEHSFWIEKTREKCNSLIEARISEN